MYVKITCIFYLYRFYTGLTCRQMIQFSLSQLSQDNLNIAIFYPDNLELDGFVDIIKQYIIIYEDNLVAEYSISPNDNYNVINNLCNNLNQYINYGIIIINFLQNEQSLYLYQNVDSVFYKHFPSEKIKIISMNTAPLEHLDLIRGSYDTFINIFDDLKDTYIEQHEKKVEVLYQIPFYYTVNYNTYWISYFSIRIFDSIVTSSNTSDINNVKKIIPTIKIFPESLRTFQQADEFLFMRRTFRTVFFKEGDSLINSLGVLLYVNYTSQGFSPTTVFSSSSCQNYVKQFNLVKVGVYIRDYSYSGNIPKRLYSRIFIDFDSVSQYFVNESIIFIPIFFNNFIDVTNNNDIKYVIFISKYLFFL